jgi:hypothetical protein
MRNEILFNREEAAKYLGVSPATLRTWGLTKPIRVPYRKLGRRCQYLKEDLDKYIKLRTFGKI